MHSCLCGTQFIFFGGFIMENKNYFSDEELNNEEFLKSQGLIQVITFDSERNQESESNNDNASAQNQTQQIEYHKEERLYQSTQDQQQLVIRQPQQTPPFSLGQYSNSYVPFDYNAIASAGLDINSARKINQAMIMSNLKIEEWKKLHALELEYEHKRKLINQSSVVRTEGSVDIVNKSADLLNLAKQFIDEFAIVKVRSSISSTGWKYMIRDKDDNRHISKSDSQLFNCFVDYVYDNISDDVEIEDTKLKKNWTRAAHKILPLNKSSLKILKNEEIMFANGVYDNKQGTFRLLKDDAKYYNRFSLLFDFKYPFKEPEVFNLMLRDMFNGDYGFIHLSYEIIGALISSTVPLKSIFVFQGKSNGGKTRLANIVIRILNGIGVYSCNDINDITDDWIQKNAQNYRLLYIKDSVDKKMTPNQRSNLKGFADGGNLENDATFKILICSNHKIHTAKDKSIVEKALQNRFVVLPFPKPMDNTDERVANFESYYFKDELNDIVLKSLLAFKGVLDNGGKFSLDIPINSCVEDDYEEISEFDSEIITIDYTPIPADRAQIINILEQCFTLVPKADSNMTTSVIISVIKAVDPQLEITPEVLGNTLSQHYGEKLETGRNAKGKFYNLAFVKPE